MDRRDPADLDPGRGNDRARRARPSAPRSARPSRRARAAFAVAVVYEAACLIEKSYYPEQVESGRSHYDQLRAEADTVLQGVRDCQAGNLPDGEASERTWQVYDVCTPAGAGCGASSWPADWWQRDLENPMP